MSIKKEPQSKSLDKGIKLITEAAAKLKVSVSITTKALILYHHFMQNVGTVGYDPAMVAAAALNLASRLEEKDISFEVICVFYGMINKVKVHKMEDNIFIKLKRSLIIVDSIMQRMLKYKLDIHIAHQYLSPIFKLLFMRSKPVAFFRREIGRNCIRFISDFYRDKNCIKYKPDHIALACIDLTLTVHGLVNKTGLVHPWYKGISKDLTAGKVKEISEKVLNLYESTTDILSLLNSLEQNFGTF